MLVEAKANNKPIIVQTILMHFNYLAQNSSNQL